MGKKKSIPKLDLRKPGQRQAPDPAAVEAFVSTGSVAPSTYVQTDTPTDVQEDKPPSVEKRRRPPKGVVVRQDGTWVKPVHFHLDFDLYRALQLARVDRGGDQTEHINMAVRSYLEGLGYDV